MKKMIQKMAQAREKSAKRKPPLFCVILWIRLGNVENVVSKYETLFQSACCPRVGMLRL
jgi:hypothetical protein